jgi:hypothetical protein
MHVTDSRLKAQGAHETHGKVVALETTAKWLPWEPRRSSSSGNYGKVVALGSTPKWLLWKKSTAAL